MDECEKEVPEDCADTRVIFVPQALEERIHGVGDGFPIDGRVPRSSDVQEVLAISGHVLRLYDTRGQRGLKERAIPIEMVAFDDEARSFTIEYPADNGRTRLVDLTIRPSKLEAPIDKIHPMPFPGLNIDNLPFFAVIAAVAQGQTLIHDWVYENRAIYLTELTKLGGQVKLLDPHRVLVEGPTHWSGAEIVCPPALRPAVVILLAMLASKGTSVLRSTYVIHRGYEDLAERLNLLGANIEAFRDI